MLYRIYTEDKRRGWLLKLADLHFASYTAIPAIGAWNEVHELSIIFEVSGTVTREAVFAFARAVKIGNKQEAVLVTALTEAFSTEVR